MFLLICFCSRKGACCDSCEDWVVMGNYVTPTCERTLIREVNWHIIESFCVYDDCLCITYAWGIPLGLCEVFCWEICRMAAIEWRMDGGFEL